MKKIIAKCIDAAEKFDSVKNTGFDQYSVHEAFTKEMSRVYKAKNADYGDSFHKSVDKHGLIAAVVRIEDKFQRFENIVKTGKSEVKEESLIDTMLDMANYCIMTAIEIERAKHEK